MVEDVDATMAQAQRAGAKHDHAAAEHVLGRPLRQLTDPFGHRWSVATHLEDLTPEQIMANSADAAQSGLQRLKAKHARDLNHTDEGTGVTALTKVLVTAAC